MVKWNNDDVVKKIKSIDYGELYVIFPNFYISTNINEGFLSSKGKEHNYICSRIENRLEATDVAFFVFIQSKDVLSFKENSGNLYKLGTTSQNVATVYKATLMSEEYLEDAIVKSFTAIKASNSEFDYIKHNILLNLNIIKDNSKEKDRI